MTDDPFARAAKRVQEAEVERRREQRDVVGSYAGSWIRTGFRIHAAVFLAVNLMLVTIWATTTPGGFPWFIYPFMGWGIGLIAHYAAVERHIKRR